MVDIEPLVTWIQSLVNHSKDLDALKSQVDDLTQKLQAEQSAHTSDVQSLQSKITDLQNNFNLDETKLQTLVALIPSTQVLTPATPDTAGPGTAITTSPAATVVNPAPGTAVAPATPAPVGS